MIRPFALAFALFLTATPSPADDKAQAEKLRKEISDLRSQLSAKEAELAKVDPVENVRYLFATSLKVGTAGPFASGFTQSGKPLQPGEVDTFKVLQVIDDSRAVLRVLAQTTVRGGVTSPTYGEVIMVGPTKGLADGVGMKATTRAYRVTGTEKHAGKTYFTVEPFEGWTPPKK